MYIHTVRDTESNAHTHTYTNKGHDKGDNGEHEQDGKL